MTTPALCGHESTTMPGDHHWVCVRIAGHPEGQHHFAKVKPAQ